MGTDRVAGCGGSTANVIANCRGAGDEASRRTPALLVAWVRKLGPQAKLVSHRTEPWHVVSHDREHVYTAQHLE